MSDIKSDSKLVLGERISSHPLMVALSEMASKFVGIRFIIVLPHGDRWEQMTPGGPTGQPEFCRLIQSAPDGAKQCKMCHILLSIAACSSGVTEQSCHAGVSVLVSPVASATDKNVNLSVLSSCVFLADDKQRAWKETEDRGKKLGLDLKDLKAAFNKLPELKGEKLDLARDIMHAAGEAAMEMKTRLLLEQQWSESQNAKKLQPGIQGAMQQELRLAMQLSGNAPSVQRKSKQKGAQIPAIISITADLVQRKYNMPFTVADIAVAARMTPNHFSTLFHKHIGENFSSYLTAARIAASKELLRDLSLNIGEVALKAGFDDPGYFTRRFRQKTGMTPREWRDSL